MFLLCADDRNQYKIILQQLVVQSFDKTKETDLLRTWAKVKSDWKNILLECLSITQCNKDFEFTSVFFGLEPTFVIFAIFDPLFDRYLGNGSRFSINR